MASKFTIATHAYPYYILQGQKNPKSFIGRCDIFKILKKILYLVAMTNIYSVLLLPVIDMKINAETTTTETTLPFLTVKIPTLGFKISYPSDWNIAFNDTVIHFRAPHNAALVTLTVSNTSLTLEQYTLYQIDILKSVDAGTFKLLMSAPYLLSGNLGHKVIFLNGTNADARHNYKTSIVWTIVGDKIYQIRYSAELTKYPTYASTILDMIDSFEIL